MDRDRFRFNSPPGWPPAPEGWVPPIGWTPPASWPEPPTDWELWVEMEEEEPAVDGTTSSAVDHIPGIQNDQEEPKLSRLQDQLRKLEVENKMLKEVLQGNIKCETELIVLDDEVVLQEIGIYEYHHPLENAVQYKERLASIKGNLVGMAKAGAAIERSRSFTFDGSLQKGEVLTRDLSRLMLQAYNAEASNCVRSLRAGNSSTAIQRINSLRGRIARLGRRMAMKISDGFHQLRVEEIELTSDFLMKKKEEREAVREERARLREERIVQEELAADRERLDKEKEHLLNALSALGEKGAVDFDLEKRLKEVTEAIERNDFRAANIRAGYVYVISNRGAFGEGVVKIGLTRRLEPIHRINELSGASVPFRFDVHGLFFSENAVGLEADLHRHFSDRRVNVVNTRKEFFFAKPIEVKEVLMGKVGALLEFTESAESTEYLQSKSSWPS
jgi:Meiotically Up-regulated Gene 113 (MUG113) protein/uncharacterized protein DUF4041